MEDTQKRNARNHAWDKQNAKKYTFKFMLKSDADVIEMLEGAENKAGLIKKALREYIANHKEEVNK